MSLIQTYREAELELAELQKRLNALSDNEELLVEMEFEEKLRALMAEYGKSLRDIIAIIDPQRQPTNVFAGKVPRRARAVKVYKNPHNGEIVETKGGNNRILKQWKAQYGADTVDSWLA